MTEKANKKHETKQTNKPHTHTHTHINTHTHTKAQKQSFLRPGFHRLGRRCFSPLPQSMDLARCLSHTQTPLRPIQLGVAEKKRPSAASVKSGLAHSAGRLHRRVHAGL